MLAAVARGLRELGFSHPIDDPKAPICRWRYSGILVDVMPFEESVLGFSNRWYPEGVQNAEKRKLPDGQEIAIFMLPYFLASKIEAFLGRGKGDFYVSEDMEDIVSVIDGASGVAEKLAGAPETVRRYIQEQFQRLLKNELFVECIQGHLGPGTGAGRVQGVLDVVRKIAGDDGARA